MSLLSIILFAATLMLAVLTVLPLWRHESWLVRGLDFPRLQLFGISALLLLIQLVLLDLSRLASYGLICITLTCTVYHGWWIAPYTRLFPVEVAPATRLDKQRLLRIMTANVLTPNRNAAALLELVRENSPHLLVTLESDAWWQSKLDALEPDYPHTIKCPLDNLYGMHVYSTLPLKNSRIAYLVAPDVPSMHALATLPSGNEINLHFLHPAPPSPTENEESSERDAELVIVAKKVAQSDAPVIVAGDLNDVAWSRTTRLFRKMSGLLDPRVGRGMFNTYHASYWFLRWPLDHLFHSHHFTLSNMKRLQGFGSDHFGLLTELVFERDRNEKDDGLEADPDDAAFAKGKVEDENVRRRKVPNPKNPKMY
jgi:endonuclease/exonuclease/phosphatase (EEP) superfamily protein YafD